MELKLEGGRSPGFKLALAIVIAMILTIPLFSIWLLVYDRQTQSEEATASITSGWGAALVRYELLLLAELGFGLDLDRCAVTGANDDLVAVSPKSGRAVSAAEAGPYTGKLLPLPPFVREGGQASWQEIAQGLDLTGHFLVRDVLTDRSRPVAEARERLVERLRRAGGLA